MYQVMSSVSKNPGYMFINKEQLLPNDSSLNVQ